MTRCKETILTITYNKYCTDFCFQGCSPVRPLLTKPAHRKSLIFGKVNLITEVSIIMFWMFWDWPQSRTLYIIRHIDVIRFPKEYT